MPTIVVPYRGDAKRRLPASLRAGAAVAMLADVVAAAVEVGRTIVVTDDASIVPAGAEALADPRRGLGAAVAAGLVAAGAGHALVVNADVPRATPGALHRLAAAGPALVAARDGTTNALSLPDPRAYAPLYGPGSAGRFAAAGFTPVEIPELVDDVDTEADLERVAPLAGPRTRALLAMTA